MAAISPANYGILSSLAARLALKGVWSTSSGYAASDIDDWLAYALSDAVQSPQLISLREEVRVLLGSNVTPTAKVLFDYYRALLDGRAPFPATVTPAAWFDGVNGAFYTDTSGTVAAAVGASVRRVNEVSPLTHTWLTPSAMRRDVGGLYLEPTDPTWPLSSSSNATSITANAMSFVCSWVKRDGDPELMHIAIPTSAVYPATVVANGGGFYALPGFASTLGARHTIGVQFTSTAIRAVLWTNGAQTASTTLTMAVSGGSPSSPDYTVGVAGNFFYGTMAQWLMVARSVSNTELAQLMAFADSQAAGPAFPIERPIIIVDGDSIAAGSPGPNLYFSWRYTMLRNVRASLDAEMIPVAVGGSTTAGHFSAAQPFLNPARQKQIVIFAAATNDIAAGFGPAALTQYLATLDQYRAAGCKVVAATVLDRTALLSISQAQFDADRATFNTGVRAATSHYDALADTAAIALLGNNGASANATYFLDGIHPTAAGHALLEPVYRAAVLSV